MRTEMHDSREAVASPGFLNLHTRDPVNTGLGTMHEITTIARRLRTIRRRRITNRNRRHRHTPRREMHDRRHRSRDGLATTMATTCTGRPEASLPFAPRDSRPVRSAPTATDPTHRALLRVLLKAAPDCPRGPISTRDETLGVAVEAAVVAAVVVVVHPGPGSSRPNANY